MRCGRPGGTLVALPRHNRAMDSCCRQSGRSCGGVPSLSRTSSVIGSISRAFSKRTSIGGCLAPSRWRRHVLALVALFVAVGSAAFGQASEPAFRTEIAAPSPLDRVLRENLDLLRWQSYDAVTPELLEQLAEQARTQAIEILATRGYFSPRVTSRIEAGENGRVVHIEVDPGEPTRVRSVHIALAGSEDASVRARLDAIRKHWSLREGDVFTQAGWDVAKGEAVAELARERYAAASVAASKARIDPEAHAADLKVTLDSGPAFTFGAIEISGLRKYSEAVVRNLSPFVADEPYSREKLDVYQRRLIATNYFASVQVTVDADRNRVGALPVRVSLIEAPGHKIDVGVGYSTDTLWRAQVDYRDVDFLGTGHRLTSTLRYETKVQGLLATLDAPPRADGWLDTYGGLIEATQIEGLETIATRVGVVRKRADERNQPALSLTYLLERQEPAGLSPDTTYAFIGTYGYTWRRTDDLLSPRTGWNAAVEVGAAPPVVSSRAFGRVLFKLNYFHPIARNVDATLRTEAGVVLAPTANGIPQAMLFRTGGDTTVRGYAFESLGVPKGDAIVGGRYYALASAETTYWVRENLGIAAFVDAGNAYDDFTLPQLKLGYGLGGRVRTPAGPLRV